MSRQYIKGRMFPGGNDRFELLDSKGVFGIGWSNIGSQLGHDKTKIIDSLNQKGYEFKDNRTLSTTAGYFVRLMGLQVGDIVLVPYNNSVVTIAEVTKTYRYDSELGRESIDLGHVVDVHVVKTVNVSVLSPKLKKSMDSQLTISDLSNYADEIDSLIQSNSKSVSISSLKLNGPTFISNNLGKHISLTIGDNVTNDDVLAFVNDVLTKRN